MRRYIAKRVGHSVFIMWLVATSVFLGLRAIPGGPVRTMLGQEATPQAIHALRHQLGLDQPLYMQYLHWMVNLVQLQLGHSITNGQPVMSLIGQAAPRTFSIAVFAVVVGLLVSIPTGLISATRKREPIDYVATVTAFLGVSTPAFFTGIVLAILFGVWLHWLPVVGYNPLSTGVLPWLKSIALPGIAVGLPYAAVIMRMMRSSLLEVLNQPYMRTARAKGLGSRTRLYKHALQNALIPVVTVAGIQLALILVGVVTVEIVFGIKGLGRLLVNSMLDRNYPVAEGAILLIAGIMVLTNLVVDVAYTAIDPRIDYQGDSSE